MRFIAAILVALSGAAMGGQDFGGHALFVRTADADPGKKICERILRVRLSGRRRRKRRYSCVVINMNLITNKWFKIH